MTRRKEPYEAQWRSIGERMLPGGRHVVHVLLSVISPELQRGRPIRLHLDAAMARHLADRLNRYADDVDELNG